MFTLNLEMGNTWSYSIFDSNCSPPLFLFFSWLLFLNSEHLSQHEARKET